MTCFDDNANELQGYKAFCLAMCNGAVPRGEDLLAVVFLYLFMSYYFLTIAMVYRNPLIKISLWVITL